jgi:hypothetical protein
MSAKEGTSKHPRTCSLERRRKMHGDLCPHDILAIAIAMKDHVQYCWVCARDTLLRLRQRMKKA